MHSIFALADDLSGAAETAAALSLRGSRNSGGVRIALDAASPGGTVVIDTDSRALPPAQATARIRSALAARGDSRVFKKIDSLLRGAIAAELEPLSEVGGVLLTPALPRLGRVVRDGVVLVDGRPLAALAAWVTEGVPAPASVAAALHPHAVTVLPLSVVRGPGLADALAAAGAVVVADAETDADLDLLARAAWLGGAAGAPAARILAGSSALAAAAARSLLPEAALEKRVVTLSDTDRQSDNPSARPLLIVVGSAEPSAARQLERLEASGVRIHELHVEELLSGSARIAPHEIAAVRVTGTAVEPRALSAALAATVAASAHADLVLTGGETARRVLDALGIRSLTLGDPILRPDGAEEFGAVRMHGPDGRTVVTRPGSFGDAESLLTILRALRPHSAATPPIERLTP